MTNFKIMDGVVYEPSSWLGNHSVLRTIDDQVWGPIIKRRIPGSIQALPTGSSERIAAVAEFKQELLSLQQSIIEGSN